MIKNKHQVAVILLATFLLISVQMPVLGAESSENTSIVTALEGASLNNATVRQEHIVPETAVIQAVSVQKDPVMKMLNAIFVTLLIIIAFLIWIVAMVIALLQKTKKEKTYRLDLPQEM